MKRTRHHWQRLHRHSLSGKLVLLFLLMAILFVLLVGGSLGKVFRDHFRNDLQPHLLQYLEYVQRDIGLPPDRERARALAEKLHLDIYIKDATGSWSSNGRPFPNGELETRHSIQRNGVEYSMARLDSHGLFSARAGQTTIYFDIPNLHPEHTIGSFMPLLLLLLVLALLYHLTRRMINPVAQLKDGIKRFGQGELDHRIQINSRDELGDLADSINDMADDIQQMLDAKRQLLLAISHELRSPLTRARVSLELMDDSEQTSGLGKDLDEMEALIEELLETERLSTRHRVLNRQPHRLAELVQQVLGQHFAGARLDLNLEQGDIRLEVDGPRIRLLLKNLLDNALRHTPATAQAPSLSISGGEDSVLIGVTDHGEGIDQKHLPHLTEPFYRADPSRQRETGGYGLGLYLCRVIAEAHGGELHIESRKGEGTQVRVRLPLRA